MKEQNMTIELVIMSKIIDVQDEKHSWKIEKFNQIYQHFGNSCPITVSNLEVPGERKTSISKKETKEN